jgi:hypothetical protein
VEGLKVQVAPSGNPEQVRLIGWLNPFSGINVSVRVDGCPGVTLTVSLLATIAYPGAETWTVRTRRGQRGVIRIATLGGRDSTQPPSTRISFQKVQYLAVQLPTLPGGTKIDYAVVARSPGRQVPSPADPGWLSALIYGRRICLRCSSLEADPASLCQG